MIPAITAARPAVAKLGEESDRLSALQFLFLSLSQLCNMSGCACAHHGGHGDEPVLPQGRQVGPPRHSRGWRAGHLLPCRVGRCPGKFRAFFLFLGCCGTVYFILLATHYFRCVFFVCCWHFCVFQRFVRVPFSRQLVILTGHWA